MKITDRDYIDYDPFSGDRDVDIRMSKVSVLVTRKPHQCLDPMKGQLHDIPAGTKVRFEKAIVDGKWGAYYVCVACMDRWLTEECGYANP